MADTKISDFTDGGGLLPDDEIAINRAGTDYKARGVGSDGWIKADAMTYASGSGGGVATMTCSGDQTAKYSIGTRFKLTQTTVKYFVVIAVSVAGGTTTVTILAGTDYTLANAAITLPYYSYDPNPQGYPGWFNYNGAATGFSSTTTNIARFALNGRVCSMSLRVAGTSNSTSKGFDIPIAPVDDASLSPVYNMYLVQDNGAAVFARYINSTKTVAAQKATTISTTPAFSATGWTASGSAVLSLTCSYLV